MLSNAQLIQLKWDLRELYADPDAQNSDIMDAVELVDDILRVRKWRASLSEERTSFEQVKERLPCGVPPSTS